MKLVVIHDFADSSMGAGATRCAIDTATGFARRGVDVTFFAAAGEPDRELLEAGVRTVTMGQDDIRRNNRRSAAFTQGLWNSPAAKQLQTIVDESDLSSTVFHVHTWSKALSPSVLPPLMRPRVNTVFHLHEYFSACPNGGFFDYPKLSICERTPMGPACLLANCDSRSRAHKVWRLARHEVMRRGAGYPAGGRDFIVLSELQRRVLAPFLPPHAAIHLMRNPIDMVQWPRQARSPDAKYLYVGRISREKGIEPLARAFADRQEDLVVVGDGPDAGWLREMLPRAEFRGWQTSTQAKEAMREARALLFPSLWYEGMPMVVLEALASGAPVLTSDSSSASEVVDHDKTGLIFRSNDPGALTEALAVLDDDAHVEALSAEAYRRYWDQPFSQERFVTEMTTVFEQVLRAAA